MSLVEDFHLAIDDGVARYFRNQSILKRCAHQPVRIRRNSAAPSQFLFDVGAHFDEEQDDLVEKGGVRFVIAKDLGDQIRGWQFIGCDSLYSEFEFYHLPPEVVSTASDPGLLTLDRERLLALEPNLSGQRGFWLRGQDRRHHTSKYLGSFDEVTSHLWRGDSRAALVLAISPQVLVAAYSDDFDAVVVLEFHKSFASKFELQPGIRLLTCNTFQQTDEGLAADIKPGPNSHTTSTNFFPLIGQFLSRDTDRMDQRMANIASAEWKRVRELADEWQVEFQNGRAQPRQGVALWAKDWIGRMRQQRSSFGRRVLATTFDLFLLTTLSFMTWWLLGLGNDVAVFWQNPKDPAARAAFREHKDTFRNVTALVYFTYATLMLLTPWRATLGKRLLGLQVVRRNTLDRVSFFQALRRSVLFLISGASGTLGCLAVLWSRSGQTWHDDRSRTCVIHTRARNRITDRLVATSVLVSCVLMGFGVIWQLETADVRLANAPPGDLRERSEDGPPPQLPRILVSDDEPLIAAMPFPELNVQLSPPKGFTPATTFVGFQHEATQSTIEVSVQQAHFDEVMKEYGFDRMRKAGWAFLGSRATTAFGQSQGEALFEQPTATGTVVKWVFVLGASDHCALAIGTAPKNRHDELALVLKASVATLRWLPQREPLTSDSPEGSAEIPPHTKATEASTDRVAPTDSEIEPTRKGGRSIRRKKREPGSGLQISFLDSQSTADSNSTSPFQVTSTVIRSTKNEI